MRVRVRDRAVGHFDYTVCRTKDFTLLKISRGNPTSAGRLIPASTYTEDYECFARATTRFAQLKG
jgi:hypothetical protein